ncbi:MAG: 2-phospho-L-lactate/phosphoenolpyruvate guanylyltransferase [Actinomycetota bacterium]|nr:2-phospho-L-lactate/phosphoenolpyruvate guanylyltransferase [Actinomycetota bacterium]
MKHLDRAKARLASHLDPDDRRALAEALLADAMKLVDDSDFLDWWVVSDDPSVLALAEGQGLHIVEDAGDGLNEALALALEEIVASGAESVTVVPCDLPLARAEDLQDILDTGEFSSIVLIPAHDGGTNGLYLRPPDAIEMRFGPQSLSVHAKAAEAAQLRCSILPLDRMEFDIDTASDVGEVLDRADGDGGATVELLERLGPVLSGD